MADPRAFISFDFDHDETFRNLFVGQAKNSRTPFNIADWSSKEKLPQSTWQTLMASKIGRCDLMIVLAGRFMSSAKGVVQEIEIAEGKNVPFFGVYVDRANSNSALPYGLARNRTIEWDWDNIARAIKQMMGEGKNRA